MTSAIDMHSHYYGGLLPGLLRRSSRPNVSSDAQGRNVLHAMTASTVMSAGYTDIAARLEYMDAHRIARQLLTFPGALGFDAMPGVEIAAAIRAYNEHLGDVCRSSNGRFLGLVGLPLADAAAAAVELSRARRELGLAGAILPGNYFLTIDAARALTPVFEAAGRAGALLMIHPGLMPGEAPPPPYADTSVFRASVLNLQASLAHMAMTVIAGGLAEAFPAVTFQVVNLGGTLPFVFERLEAVAASREPHVPFRREALRSMVYDCASLGPRALELAVRVFGADRIMLGTDYPIFAPDQVGATVEASDLTDREKDQVLRGTAQSVLERLVA